MSTKIIASILETELKLIESEIKDLWSIENKEHFYFQVSSDLELFLLDEDSNDQKSGFCELLSVFVVNLNQLKSYLGWKEEGYSTEMPYSLIQSEFIQNLSEQVNKEQLGLEYALELEPI